MVRGIATAHSHTFFKERIISQINYVWPDAKGETIGLLIEPFYPKQVQAVKESPEFYELMALTDTIE